MHTLNRYYQLIRWSKTNLVILFMRSFGHPYNPFRLFVGCFIPNALLQSSEVSSSAKLVFGRLCQFAGENGQAYPSYKTIGRELGISRRQTLRAVKELKEFGLIRVVGRCRADGGSMTNIYEFLWHEILENNPNLIRGDIYDTPSSVNGVLPPGCHESHPRVSLMTSKKRQIKQKTFEDNSTEQIYVLLSDTPFNGVTKKEMETLILRHGIDRLTNVADIAAEIYRREGTEIVNPGGYLQSLCQYCETPNWFQPYEIRQSIKVKAEAAKQKLEDERKKEEADRLKESMAIDSNWESLSEEQKKQFRNSAIEFAPFKSLEPTTIEALAKCDAFKKVNTKCS